MTGTIGKVTVTLHGFAHSCPTDVDMLLVGPHGQESILMSDAGDCTGDARLAADISFDDAAAKMPCYMTGAPALAAGTYAPADYGPSDTSCSMGGPDPDVFDPPAPPGPWPIGLGAFNGVDANGIWRLYTMDQYKGDSGSISGGWSIDVTIPPATLTRAPRITGSADVGKTLTAVSGTLGNGAAAAYQWSRCNRSGKACSPIAGAAQSTYKPSRADRGHALIVTETGVTSGGNSAPLASKPTKAVGPALLSSAGTKLSQHVLRAKGVIVAIKSNIGGTLSAGGTVSVPKGARTVRLKTVKESLRAGKRTSLNLKLSNAGLKAISAALARGQKLKAKVTLVVKDAGGARSAKRLAVRLQT